MSLGFLPRSVRRLPLLVLGTTVLLVGLGIALAVYVDRVTIHQQIEETQGQAKILASTVTAALAFNDRQAAQEYVNAIKANPEIAAAAIYDASGMPFVKFSREGPPLPERLTALGPPHLHKGFLIVEEPVRQGTTVLGSVYLRGVTDHRVAGRHGHAGRDRPGPRARGAGAGESGAQVPRR
jgi:uncharacterized membrane protein affecting hemolysin expression